MTHQPHDWSPSGDYYECSKCATRMYGGRRRPGYGIPVDGCRATANRRPGQIHLVKAWWATPKWSLVRCRILAVHRETISVRPLEGPSHTRVVGFDALADDATRDGGPK